MDFSSIPSIGDAIKSVCEELGVADDTSDWIVAGTCLATGDYLGATKYGMECYGHLGVDGVDRAPEGVRLSCGYDLDTKAGWLKYMQDDPDAAIAAYYQAMANGTLPDDLAKDTGFQMAMNNLVQMRNREIQALSSLQQAIHETLKQVCTFRV